MNLDFSQYPELDGPIVLLVGCPQGASVRSYLMDDTLVEANAQAVKVLDIRVTADMRWWIYPFREESMFQIFRRYTRKTYHSIVKWMETDKFVSDVRGLLAEMVEQETSLEQLPENWPELVSLVVLDESLEPNDSPYVQRVFDGWFPNAKFREQVGFNATRPIWREAEVKDLGDLRSYLETSLDQWTALTPEIVERLEQYGFQTGRHLTKTSPTHLATILLPDQYTLVLDAAAKYNVRLLSEDERLDNLRSAVGCAG